MGLLPLIHAAPEQEKGAVRPRPFGVKLECAYVQLLLAWKSALDGSGPAALHVLPLTVSVRQ